MSQMLQSEVRTDMLYTVDNFLLMASFTLKTGSLNRKMFLYVFPFCQRCKACLHADDGHTSHGNICDIRQNLGRGY